VTTHENPGIIGVYCREELAVPDGLVKNVDGYLVFEAAAISRGDDDPAFAVALRSHGESPLPSGLVGLLGLVVSSSSRRPPFNLLYESQLRVNMTPKNDSTPETVKMPAYLAACLVLNFRVVFLAVLRVFLWVAI
jgi:hypothetical protein